MDLLAAGLFIGEVEGLESVGDLVAEGKVLLAAGERVDRPGAVEALGEVDCLGVAAGLVE